jgi:peptidoglycan LD-endopeptidase LytH
VAWRIPVRDGQHLAVTARLHGEAAGRLFIEVFRVPRDAGDELFPMASADDTTRTLAVEATRTADVIVRLQPELLRGGRYEVEVDANGAPAGQNRRPGRPLLAGQADRR